MQYIAASFTSDLTTLFSGFVGMAVLVFLIVLGVLWLIVPFYIVAIENKMRRVAADAKQSADALERIAGKTSKRSASAKPSSQDLPTSVAEIDDEIASKVKRHPS